MNTIKRSYVLPACRVRLGFIFHRLPRQTKYAEFHNDIAMPTTQCVGTITRKTWFGFSCRRWGRRRMIFVCISSINSYLCIRLVFGSEIERPGVPTMQSRASLSLEERAADTNINSVEAHTTRCTYPKNVTEQTVANKPMNQPRSASLGMPPLVYLSPSSCGVPLRDRVIEPLQPWVLSTPRLRC